jgi:hypothetical protein
MVLVMHAGQYRIHLTLLYGKLETLGQVKSGRCRQIYYISQDISILTWRLQVPEACRVLLEVYLLIY